MQKVAKAQLGERLAGVTVMCSWLDSRAVLLIVHHAICLSALKPPNTYAITFVCLSVFA